jgi:hypothetical protein
VQPANIMFDRRVVRGNTYAARLLPAELALQLGTTAASDKATRPADAAA